MSSNCWLKPAILAIQLSQMMIQALWLDEPSILQIPHFDLELAQKFKQHDVNDIPDFMNMDEELRESLLQMDQDKVAEMAEFCNKYPSIGMDFQVEVVEDQVQVHVSLQREIEEDEYEGKDIVVAPFYPKVNLVYLAR